MGEMRLGCSGWSYGHWKDFLYKDVSPRRHLELYAKFFNCVEVNMTFYRFPTTQVMKNWFESTPDNFLFAIKLNRSITHMKKLQGVNTLLESFLNICYRLDDKFGPLLVQLPSSFSKDTRRLEIFLSLLPDIRVAFEFRNESWFDNGIFKLLNNYNAALVMLGSQFHKNYTVYTNFAYIRWHGRGGQLDNYSQDEISYWADRIRAISESADVYGFWNNDAFAYAPKNCLELLKKLELR
jgi:uncharacterized protein YecE (DUF72 family)